MHILHHISQLVPIHKSYRGQVRAERESILQPVPSPSVTESKQSSSSSSSSSQTVSTDSKLSNQCKFWINSGRCTCFLKAPLKTYFTVIMK